MKAGIVLKTMLVFQGSREKVTAPHVHGPLLTKIMMGLATTAQLLLDLEVGAAYPGRHWSHSLGTLKPLTLALERCHQVGHQGGFCSPLGARILARTPSKEVAN